MSVTYGPHNRKRNIPNISCVTICASHFSPNFVPETAKIQTPDYSYESCWKQTRANFRHVVSVSYGPHNRKRNVLNFSCGRICASHFESCMHTQQSQTKCTTTILDQVSQSSLSMCATTANDRFTSACLMSQSKVFHFCSTARDQYKLIPTMHFVQTTLASVLDGDHKGSSSGPRYNVLVS